MSRLLDEPMTGRDNPPAHAVAPPQSNDAPIIAARRSGVPLPLVAHMVARLVGGQEIAASDIPALVETVNATLAEIIYPRTNIAPAADQFSARGQRLPRPPREGVRKPGRPRKVEVPQPVEPPVPPPVPRLVRRAEAVVSAPAAGLTRLFKGQEIEAQIERVEGRVRISALRVPGGSATTPAVSGPIAAMGGRRPRMVMVEKKRDALKRVAARTEAEHLLGPTGVPKPR